ncbi:MAG: LysM peptidoglycan-binding domain-containing protein [Ectothiorhodospiraceae bacterium]|nr:LysM peptidoglycan-binding domain-containing protein [Ectothiorhodospiraceae bacterium]
MFRGDHPDRYTVVRGDTLWDISTRFLNSPWYWPEIWHVNPEIENPHLIYPGDVITLIYVDGEPRLTVERGVREVRLSPGIREEQLPAAIDAIPMDAIRPFLNRSHVVDRDFFNRAPYIVAGEDERVMASQGDRVYVRRLADGEEQGGYSVVREGSPFRDLQTGEILGIEATHVGELDLMRGGDPATAQVLSSNREVLSGDRLMRIPREPASANFFPKAPDGDLEGQVIHVLDGVTQIGQFDVVVLNLGEEQGAEVGDVLAVYKAGRRVRDQVTGDRVTLPEERAGELIIFRTFDKVSFGLVMRANRHMAIADIVRNP